MLLKVIPRYHLAHASVQPTKPPHTHTHSHRDTYTCNVTAVYVEVYVRYLTVVKPQMETNKKCVCFFGSLINFKCCSVMTSK